MTFEEFVESLRLAPTAWADMSAEQQDAFNVAFPVGQPFGEQQREWVNEWWLACDQTQIEAINTALAPLSMAVGPVDIMGSLFLGSDLLTDSQNPGQSYNAAFGTIETLIFTEFEGGPPPSQPEEPSIEPPVEPEQPVDPGQLPTELPEPKV